MANLKFSEQQIKLAREVGSIVLGVLIALGIGEIAEAARWKLRVDSSTSAMTQELKQNHYIYVERTIVQPCIEDRLGEIQAILLTARNTGVLPKIENVWGPGGRFMQSTAFDVSNSEGVPLHMNSAKAHELAQIYQAGDYYRVAAEKEREYWTNLFMLKYYAGRMDAEMLGLLLESLAGAKTYGAEVAILAQQAHDELTKAGISVEYEPEFPNHAALTRMIQSHPLCKPLIVDAKPFQPAA